MKTAHTKLLFTTTCLASALLGLFFTSHNSRVDAVEGQLTVNSGTSGTGTFAGLITGTASPYSATFTNNVGIGTTSPTTKLEVNDQTAVSTFTGDNDTGIRIHSNDAATNNYAILGFTGYSASYNRNLAQIGATFTGSGSYLSFGTSADYGTGITNTAMTIDYSGNVGIGTTSPGAKLDLANGNMNFTNTFGPVFKTAAGATTNQIYLGADDKLKLYVAGSDRVTIDTSGKVGIGTAAPSVKLDIAGCSLRVLYGQTVGMGTDGSGSYFGSNEYMNGACNAWVNDVPTAASGMMYIDSAGAINFFTRPASYGDAVGTSKMSILNGGSVNIGSFTGDQLLNVNGNIHTYSGGVSKGYVYTDGTNFGLLNNAGNWMLYSGTGSQAVTFPGTITTTGLTFSTANPTISASSYFTAPGGAYFSSGIVYTEATIAARGGIADDGGDLGLLDNTYVTGGLAVGTTTIPPAYQILVHNPALGAGSYWQLGQATPTGNFAIIRDTNGLGPYQPYTAPSATWSYTSDKRLKTNIQSLSDNQGLNVITKLRPVNYNWISKTSPQSTQTGFIAQEVQQIVPEAVSLAGKVTMTLADGTKETIPDTLGVGSVDFIPYMVKAIQEQQTQIEDLKNKLNDQQKQIDELKDLINSK